MDKWEKLSVLAEDSKYDLSCACSCNESERRRRKSDGTWLYPVQLVNGGTGIMLKTLISNACSSDCRYCPLRRDGAAAQRCSLTADETAALFMEHLRKQWLMGIFLSSGIIGTADRTMQLLTDTAEILRKKYRYRGYIHLKVIPGASEAAIQRALQLASAVSLNIEVPGAKYFRQLSDFKRFDEDIVRPLKFISEQTAPGSDHARIKCTTQFLVGAANESDHEIVRYTDAVYKRLKFERVYFSAFQPVPGASEKLIGAHSGQGNFERLMREHRLYQADFLLRQYHFGAEELVFDAEGNFDLSTDPKRRWADLHPEQFPVKVNRADKEQLLRIPGIGPTYADRILKFRRELRVRTLASVGMKGKALLLAERYVDFS